MITVATKATFIIECSSGVLPPVRRPYIIHLLLPFLLVVEQQTSLSNTRKSLAHVFSLRRCISFRYVVVILCCFVQSHFSRGKVQFTPLNYHKSLIFNLKLQNRIRQTIQLSKKGKFVPLGVFEGVFHFIKIKNIQI